jgi:hypothetical protein
VNSIVTVNIAMGHQNQMEPSRFVGNDGVQSSSTQWTTEEDDEKAGRTGATVGVAAVVEHMVAGMEGTGMDETSVLGVVGTSGLARFLRFFFLRLAQVRGASGIALGIVGVESSVKRMGEFLEGSED